LFFGAPAFAYALARESAAWRPTAFHLVTLPCTGVNQFFRRFRWFFADGFSESGSICRRLGRILPLRKILPGVKPRAAIPPGAIFLAAQNRCLTRITRSGTALPSVTRAKRPEHCSLPQNGENQNVF
jgi:hypothetical protein